MAEFVEVIKNRERMCDYYASCFGCIKCPLSGRNNGHNEDCRGVIIKHPSEAEKIIMNWVAEHPPFTNADKFREVFGVEVDKSGSGCYGLVGVCNEETCKYCDYLDFWKKEYKEQKNE